ncbi:MAG: pyrimidine dimer DNA glycosylase/endonuclease V [Gammaproteobacteria bacterium]
MRLWSLHPKYLDTKGLVALWREGLLAQAVLAGRTRGYRHHPQLTRFLRTSAPRKYIAEYLRLVQREAARRGYRFDRTKIGRGGAVEPLKVTRGQIQYEWGHLTHKLATRAPAWLEQIGPVARVQPHPLFKVVAGRVAEWEVVVPRNTGPARIRVTRGHS